MENLNCWTVQSVAVARKKMATVLMIVKLIMKPLKLKKMKKMKKIQVWLSLGCLGRLVEMTKMS